MKLTNAQLKAAKNESSVPKKISDGRGLALYVYRTGGKTWKLRHRDAAGKQRDITLGKYPEVKLAKARELAEKHRLAKAEARSRGIDYRPVVAAPESENRLLAPTFEEVAKAFITNQTAWSTGHKKRFVNRMERDVFPLIGSLPVDEIKVADVKSVISKVSSRGSIDTAHRVKQMIGQILDVAGEDELIVRNSARLLRKSMPKRPPTAHRKAITDSPARFGEFLRDLYSYPHINMGIELLRFATLTFQRPGEIRLMRWEDVDWKNGRWVFEVTKVGREHIVPLSTQATTQLQLLHQLNGNREWTFATTAGRPMSDVRPSQMMNKLGWSDEQSTHGLRATARTMLVEQLGYDRKWVEVQLSHTSSELHGHSYDRAQFLKGRTTMMQAWADFLDSLRSIQSDRAQPLPIPKSVG